MAQPLYDEHGEVVGYFMTVEERHRRVAEVAAIHADIARLTADEPTVIEPDRSDS